MYKYLLVMTALLSPVCVQAELTTNIGTANKYMFRGVKQSGPDIIAHGGIDYNGPWGVYAGAWGYTGSIEDFDSSEVNAYGGFAFNLWNMSVGLGAIAYERSESKPDNTEYNLNLAWNAYRLSSYQDEDDTYQYHEVAANYDVFGDGGIVVTAGMLDPKATGADETFNYSVSWVQALPNGVDFEVNVLRHDDKGNSLVLGLTRQFEW
ncbi:TorF family putative porin [Bermanella sp. R86510]|uniref:TorF family putative porin n=1 Tax=unclassified Bermanella TaxID=2627862 RepID=UPI0037C611B4